MNWYKKIAKAKTLYHGTSINHYDSIKRLGLIPDVGDFVSDMYEGDYEEAGVEFDPTPVTFAADKENLRSAINAMEYAVGKMIGKTNNITSDDIRRYGMLIILKEGGEYWDHRPEEEIGPLKDWHGETDNLYPTVERGDYFSESVQGPVEILIGNKMVEFLKKHGMWSEDNITQLRKDLATISIRYYIKKFPHEEKNNIINQVKNNINNLDDGKVKEYYNQFLEKTVV